MDLRRHTPMWRTAFEVGSTVVMVALAAALVWQGRARLSGSTAARPPLGVPIPAEPIPIGTGAVRGVASAPVAIIEYADFECPSCAQFARGIEPALFREYVDNGRVVVVFKHFPLRIHPTAQAAAQAAWCAARQEKFWEMHDALYRIRGLQDSDLQAAAKQIGLDLALYDSCRAADQAGQHVQMEKAEGERLKVPGTPTFFVGRVTADHRVQVTDAVVGSRSLEELKTILDRLLSK